MNEKKLEGVIELALLESVDADKGRGEIRSLETGGRQSVVLTQSPYMGIMPIENTLLAVYRKQGFFTRMILPLDEIVPKDQRTIDQRLEEETEAPLGDVDLLEPGECYFGRYGRIFFDKNGSARLYSDAGNLSITLNNLISKIQVVGDNYSLSTPGDGIRIRTMSSLPTTYGDVLRIEKNVPTVTLPEELLSVQPPAASISYMELDSTGGISISSSIGTAKLLLSAPPDLLSPGIPGTILLANTLAKLDVDPTGGILLRGPIASLEMLPTGDISMENGVSTVKLTSGSQALLSAASTEVRGTSDLLMLSLTSATLQAPAITINGNVSSTGTFNVTGITTLTGNMFFVGLPSFVGAPVVQSLTGVMTVAKIPVLVNGVIAGFIPVIP